MRELGRIRESSETSKKIESVDMIKQADEINAILKSIELDDFDREKVYGIDQEQARKDEKKEFTYSSEPDVLSNDEDIYEQMEKQADEINAILKSIELDDFDREKVYGIDQEQARKDEKKEFTYSSEPDVQSRDDYQEMMNEISSSVTNTQENQQIHEKLEIEKQKISELLEKTENIPNEPTVVHSGSGLQQPKNIWDDLNCIDPNSEEYLNGLERLYEIQVERLAILKANNSPEFETQLNFAVQNILNRIDKMPNARDQLLYDVEFYLSHSMTNTVSNTNNKDELILNIIKYMYPNGTEYVPVNDIKRQLEIYSEEELKEMISQYETQMQELNSGSMHR